MSEKVSSVAPKTGDVVTNMTDFQKKYFPKCVGKICPCCGRDYITGERPHGWEIKKPLTVSKGE